jgi:4-hydroxy-3-polyprenylbenzoate decarboxylase
MELPIEGVFHNLTIVKIKTEYEGHAQKVMNAMWGAGQMMFNKILVITDKIDIHNYAKVADYVSKHVDPYNDIYFSAGPMDVLDHSCSKFAFGSKVCIDATEKTDAHILVDACSIIIDTPDLQQKFPGISGINTQLLKAGFSVIAVGVKKTLPAQIETLHKQLVLEEGVNQVKFIIYVNDVVELSDFGVVTWNTANNIDPRRDMILSPAGKYGISHCGIDGTRKTKKLDNFQRDWPNVIAMDAAIIETIDKKWEVLGLGKFLPSPSLKYVGQVMNKGAVVIEN